MRFNMKTMYKDNLVTIVCALIRAFYLDRLLLPFARRGRSMSMCLFRLTNPLLFWVSYSTIPKQNHCWLQGQLVSIPKN